MIFIGLTGGIGSGKSTVMSILAQKGAVTADADSLAKDLMSNDNNLIRAISRRFGPDCWKNGVLQTAVLAKRAFQDPEAQMELNEIVHPALNKYIRNVFIPVYKNQKLVVMEVPLLYEAGYESLFDAVLLITADKEVREGRALWRGRQSTESIRQRMALQMPEKEKIEKSPYVVCNNGSYEELEKQTISCLRQIIRDLGRSGE